MKITFAWARKYLLERLSMKRVSENTLLVYEQSMNCFEKYLVKTGVGDLRNVDGHVLDEYLSYLRDYRYGSSGKKKYSAITIDMRIRHVLKLFSLLAVDEHIFNQPVCRGYVRNKEKLLLRNILTKDEVNRLLSIPDVHTYLGFRNRTILEVLYGTGIRMGELLTLDIYDIDFGERVIYIRQGKGGKDRIVPCTRRAFCFLREYLNKVRPALTCFNSRENALFVSDKRGIRLTKSGFVHMLDKYVKQAGITKRITPHSFRHTFASHMLAGGANIRYIQQILGHENLSTTEIYTRVVIVDLKKMVKQYHPLENELFSRDRLKIPEKKHLTRRKRICKKEENDV